MRWLAVGEPSEITSTADLEPERPAGAGGQGALALAFAKTGVPDDPGQTPGTPPPLPKAPPPAGRQAPAPARAAPQGYPEVPPAVAGEAYQRNPNVIVHSGSHDFHRMVWNWRRGRRRAAARVPRRQPDPHRRRALADGHARRRRPVDEAAASVTGLVLDTPSHPTAPLGELLEQSSARVLGAQTLVGEGICVPCAHERSPAANSHVLASLAGGYDGGCRGVSLGAPPL